MSTANPTAEPRPLDARGRLRSPATYPGAGAGKPPTNKGQTYPAEPYTNEEILVLLRHCVPTSKYAGKNAILGGERLKAAIVVMFRAGLRVQETLDLTERDLDREQRQITVRCGKGGKRRVVGMDEWGWKHLDRWVELRRELPVGGPLFCTVQRDCAGRAWDQGDVRRSLKAAGKRAGLRRRHAPHQLRHGFACGAWREEIDVLTIQRSLGHARLDVTQAYLIGLGNDDLLKPVTERKAPMVPMTV